MVMRDWRRHGDYEPWGNGGLKLVQPKTCSLGHPVVGSSGWSPCPRFGVPTNVWWCSDPRCAGKRTSRAHELDCPTGA